ncbi:MAG: hypothetical protein AB7R89_25905 [Dehalococcoidia bacterium]
MKLAVWKRTVLAGLLALIVAGGSLATFTASNASAARITGDGYVCIGSGSSWVCHATKPD